MSAPAAESATTAEPNLTPLLDVVLQLLMFFVISANFKTVQFKGDIVLPHSQSALPFETTDSSTLIINMKPFRPQDYKDHSDLAVIKEKFAEGDAVVQVPFRPEMRLLEVKFWLINKYQTLEREAADGKVKTSIILRADGDTRYEDVFDMMNLCKTAGFRTLKLGAVYDIKGKASE